MSLTPGTRLGPYEILAPIGAGGMGEVYRARDTQLNRDVAIKVLPELFASDPERLARFEREAQALASLNHPNIAQIYGIERSGLSRALVMELIDGEDLSRRIAAGSLDLDQSLAIATQIAEALEAAQDRGIVHRDLKPANIKIRDDGTVKVLDFGLAKALDTVAAGPDVHNSPTFTSPAMTRAGMILGTAAYMAPEQAKGKAVDKRADIWAFGCVLFEMLTGRAAFAHDSVAETLGAVIGRDPDWTLLPSRTPVSVRHLLARCLERDPRRRLRDIGEARLLLEGAGFASLGQSVAPARRPLAVTLGVLAAGAVAGAGLAYAISMRGGPTSASATRALTLRQLTELPGPEVQPDISPDGRQVVFTSAAAGNRDIYLLRVGGARPINLTQGSSADDQQASFSPDGERIAFRSGRDGGGIYVMGATGESVRLVTRAGFDPAWSPDARSLAYATEPTRDPYARYGVSHLWIVEIASGNTVQLTKEDGVQPAWSPDGGRIAYWANTGGQRDLWTVSASGGAPVPVTQDAATDWSPEWSADGTWLYFSSDRGGTMNIWRVAIDQTTGEPRSAPEPITSSLTPVGFVRFGADQRRAVVMAYETTHELMLSPLSGPATEPAVLRSPSLGWCSPSPAADWLACTSRTAQEDIVLLRADGSETIRLTDDGHKDRNPTWSPDGSRIAFMSSRSGAWELWSIRRDGSDLRQMTDLKSGVYDLIWSSDGRRGLTSSLGLPGAVWIFDVATMATRENATFFESPAGPNFSPESWSPDGRLVAGSILDGTGTPLQPVVWEMSGGAVRRLEVPPPVNPFAAAVAGWLPDSRRFLFASGKGLVVVDATTGRWTPFAAPGDAIRYRLSFDGRTLHTEREVLDADIWLVEQPGDR